MNKPHLKANEDFVFLNDTGYISTEVYQWALTQQSLFLPSYEHTSKGSNPRIILSFSRFGCRVIY